jgi:predicted permease
LFGGSDDAVGRDVRVNGVPYSIVGVLGPDLHSSFSSEGEEPQLYVPAAFTADQRGPLNRHGGASYSMIARLRNGADLTLAQEQIDALNRRNLEQFPMFKSVIANTGFHTHAVRAQDDLIRDVRTPLCLLWAGAVFVLLVGAVNVATLLLMRSTARLKEFATRHVLGASPGRLSRQMLTETAQITLMGGLAGLLLGYLALRLIARLGLERLPRSGEIGMDFTAVVVTLAAALLMGVVLGLVPMLSIRMASLSRAFSEEGRQSTSARGTRLMRSCLVTAQVAIALLLLVNAGLLFVSFRRVNSVEPGFDANDVITVRVTLPSARYADARARGAFLTRALDGIRALPGVAHASVASCVPFGDAPVEGVMTAEGYTVQPGESPASSSSVSASDGYFEAMKIGLLRGRFFDRREVAEAPPVVIVDARLARKYWPHDDPIMKRMYIGAVAPGPNTRYLTVVGVVKDVKYLGLVPAPGLNPAGTYYLPAQAPGASMFFVVRTMADPHAAVSAIRKAVASVDSELPIWEPLTMGERLDRSLVTRRTPMLLALAFAGVALLLATVGVYGVLAYQVTQRTREIGVRMAMGGGLPAIFRLVLWDGLRMVVVGVAIGLAGGVAMSRALQNQLFGVSALDPAVVTLVAALLGLVALAACIVPAMRAARVDPVKALTDL